MNASMARRIRIAEAVLISAIDRRRCGQRAWSRRDEPAQQTVRMPIPLAFATIPEPAPGTCTEPGRPN
jgi:hypothetical protein